MQKLSLKNNIQKFITPLLTLVLVLSLLLPCIPAVSADNPTVSGVWVFNETPTFDLGERVSVSFTSNGQSFSSMYFVQGDGEIYYDSVMVGEFGAFLSEEYRTVDFGDTEQTVSDDFYTWLTTNATQQVETTYTVSGVWVFNDVLDIDGMNVTYDVNFVSSSVQYVQFQIYTSGASEFIYFIKSDGSKHRIYNSGFLVESRKTIDFGTTPQEVSSDFYIWLTSNASPVSSGPVTYTVNILDQLTAGGDYYTAYTFNVPEGSTISVTSNGAYMTTDDTIADQWIYTPAQQGFEYFDGFGRQPNDNRPDYTSGDTITVTQDMDLYVQSTDIPTDTMPIYRNDGNTLLGSVSGRFPVTINVASDGLYFTWYDNSTSDFTSLGAGTYRGATINGTTYSVGSSLVLAEPAPLYLNIADEVAFWDAPGLTLDAVFDMGFPVTIQITNTGANLYFDDAFYVWTCPLIHSGYQFTGLSTIAGETEPRLRPGDTVTYETAVNFYYHTILVTPEETIPPATDSDGLNNGNFGDLNDNIQNGANDIQSGLDQLGQINKPNLGGLDFSVENIFGSGFSQASTMLAGIANMMPFGDDLWVAVALLVVIALILFGVKVK